MSVLQRRSQIGVTHKLALGVDGDLGVAAKERAECVPCCCVEVQFLSAVVLSPDPGVSTVLAQLLVDVARNMNNLLAV